MPQRSIFKTKTFWLNLLLLVGNVATGGLVPPKFGVPIALGANVALRFLSNGPVGLLGDPQP